jgi:cysteine desulfuration protein SufE
MAALPAKLQAMVDELKEVDDLADKYEILIEMGKEVAPIDEAHKVPECLVHGCQSVLHVWPEIKEGKIYFHGFADAMIVNGLLSFYVLGCSGMKVEEFAEFDPGFIKETGVVASLTPSRVNGFYNIHQKYLEQVKQLTGAQ